MHVTKRDGTLEKLNFENIRKQTIPATEGLDIDYEELELAANISFTDGIKTEDIQQVLIQTALGMNDLDKPKAIYVAGRLELYDLYHNIKRLYLGRKKSGDVYKLITFKDYIEFNKEELSYIDVLDKFDLDRLDSVIDSDKDKLFTYLAVKTLEERYFIKINDKVSELPQHALMSEACFLAQNEDNPTERAIEFYKVMSNLEFMPATPTLSNGRKKNGNCFSCAVGSTPDNLIDIFNAYSIQAQGSKYGTGFGWDWTRVRSNGGTIDKHKGAANGVIPFLKIENDISVAVDQLGLIGYYKCANFIK